MIPRSMVPLMGGAPTSPRDVVLASGPEGPGACMRAAHCGSQNLLREDALEELG